MSVYADTSFFVSIYVNDRHSQEARRRATLGGDIWLTPLHRAEWEHALSQHVFRKFMNKVEAERTRKRFAEDCDSGLWRGTELPGEIFDAAVALARIHVPVLGTRTLDTLHVACAVELKAQQFWTFDERQAKLAKAVGLKVT